MTQQIINVGAAPNDGQGDPIRTAFTKCNNNFTELYDREQTTPPPTLVGSVGDVAGMYAYDENFYYYCFENFDGSTQIWNKVPQTGNAQVTLLTATGNIISGGNVTADYFIGDGSQLTNVIAGAPTSLVNGNSNVIVRSDANVTISAGGYSNIVTVGFNPSFTPAQGMIVVGQVLVSDQLRTLSYIDAAGNITGGNINSNSRLSGVSLSLTGNVVGNLNLSNNLVVSGNAQFLNSITGNANVTGTVHSDTNITATGNITAGGYFIGDGQYLTNITAVSNVAVSQIANGSSVFAVTGTGANITGTVGSTLVLTLSSGGANVIGYIDSTGNIDGANVNSDGRILAVGNITGGNLTTGGKVVASGNIDGISINATQQVVATGNITGGNLITTGLLSVTGNITGGNVSGTLLTGTLATAAQPNITSTGTLTSLTVSGNINTGSGATTINSGITTTGNITGSNIITTGLGSFGTTVVATGNITGGNLITAGLIDSTGNISGGNINTGGRVLSTGNITGGNLTTGGLIVTTGNVNANNVIATATISATGNITGGNLITAGLISTSSISKTGSNAVGNIGNSSSYFNTVFAATFTGTSATALYADLAERYTTDQYYEPGTVLSFGGSAELTLSTDDADATVAGVVSTQPAYEMNSGLEGEFVTKLALVGRVPCRVQGPVTRGAMMVSAGNGLARAEAHPAMGTVIGKALEDFDGDQGTIEIVVGRL